MKLSRRVLCLDWDKRALRLVVARVGGGGMQLEDAHSHRLPASVDSEDPKSMGEFIQQMLKRHRVGIKRVIVDVPRDKAVLNQLTLAPTPDEELAAAVRFQAVRELTFPLEEAVIDYVVTKRDDQKRATEVLLAAVPLETLDRLRETCAAAGLTPARIGLRPYANLISAWKVADLADKRALLVDVGPVMTEIDVAHERRLSFARAANVNVPPLSGAAEDSRILSMTDVNDFAATDEAVDQTVNELLVEITRTLQAYRATEPAAEIHLIIISGSTGIEQQLVAAAEQRFQQSCMLFDPTETLGISVDDAPKLRSFSAVLGLAWGLSDEGSLALDFLNPKKPIPPRQTLKRRARLAGLAATAVAVAGIAWVVNERLKLRGELEAKQEALSELRAEVLELAEIEHMVARVEEWAVQPVWPEHLLNLTASAIDPGKDMLVESMSLNAPNASIRLRKVKTSRMDIATEFVTFLNELAIDGQRQYEATQGTWGVLTGRDHGDFTSQGEITVNLQPLAEHHESEEDREKARKKELSALKR